MYFRSLHSQTLFDRVAPPPHFRPQNLRSVGPELRKNGF